MILSLNFYLSFRYGHFKLNEKPDVDKKGIVTFNVTLLCYILTLFNVTLGYACTVICRET